MFGFSCAEWTIPNVLIRIVVSMILGCVIGLDRGLKKRGAGTKTNTIVCLGATLVMLTAQYMEVYFPGKSDLSRMASQVIRRGRISWSRNHHCVRASGEGTDNCGKFMGMCMRWSCSGDRVSGWWSYHYGV